LPADKINGSDAIVVELYARANNLRRSSKALGGQVGLE
jgi:hypothetical protein